MKSLSPYNGAAAVLSNTAEYALRIMITLAEAADEPLTSERIAELTRVPGDYAVKVLQWLGRADMVRGQRGRKGGFRLACDPKTTSLLDVVNVIDPLERISACPLGREAHESELCPLHTRLDEVVGILIDSLGQMTLESVINGQQGPTLCEPDAVPLRVTAVGSANPGKNAGKS
ncbi:MAG: RrF2 family transcriptional regulator [Planctomycetota bacterium]